MSHEATTIESELYVRAWELLPFAVAAGMRVRSFDGWYDHRVLGISQHEIAVRDGVTHQAVSLWVRQGDTKIAAAAGLAEARCAA